jgi:Ca2+/Na+ antiporter
MIQLIVFLVDVFWWAVINVIIVYCLYKLFDKFRYRYYDEPETPETKKKFDVNEWYNSKPKQ